MLPSLSKSKVAEFMQVLNDYLQIFEDNMRGTESGKTDYSLPTSVAIVRTYYMYALYILPRVTFLLVF